MTVLAIWTRQQHLKSITHLVEILKTEQLLPGGSFLSYFPTLCSFKINPNGVGGNYRFKAYQPIGHPGAGNYGVVLHDILKLVRSQPTPKTNHTRDTNADLYTNEYAGDTNYSDPYEYTVTPTLTNTPTNTPVTPTPTNTPTNTPATPTLTNTPTNTPVTPTLKNHRPPREVLQKLQRTLQNSKHLHPTPTQ